MVELRAELERLVRNAAEHAATMDERFRIGENHAHEFEDSRELIEEYVRSLIDRGGRAESYAQALQSEVAEFEAHLRTS